MKGGNKTPEETLAGPAASGGQCRSCRNSKWSRPREAPPLRAGGAKPPGLLRKAVIMVSRILRPDAGTVDGHPFCAAFAAFMVPTGGVPAIPCPIVLCRPCTGIACGRVPVLAVIPKRQACPNPVFGSVPGVSASCRIASAGGGLVSCRTVRGSGVEAMTSIVCPSVAVRIPRAAILPRSRNSVPSPTCPANGNQGGHRCCT